MFESFVENVSGQVVVVARERSTYTVPDGLRGRVRLVRLEGLVYGRGKRRASVQAFAGLLAGAESFSVVGADVVDGGYGARVAVIEWNLAQVAAESGVASRVLGFSWGAGIAPVVAGRAGAAAGAGVQSMVRDALSAERFRRDTHRDPLDVADMVFLLDGVDRSEPEYRQAGTLSAAGPLLLVNVSSLIASRADVVSEYVEIVRQAQARGMQVLFVPHVGDVSGGDLAAIGEVRQRMADMGLSVPQAVERLLSPQQIKGLAECATLVVTGRMHLAILAMSVGTPSVVLATHGKVDGLMQMVGLRDWAVEPKTGFAASVAPIIEDVARGDDRFAQAVRDTLPRLREMSAKNFDGLQ